MMALESTGKSDVVVIRKSVILARGCAGSTVSVGRSVTYSC